MNTGCTRIGSGHGGVIPAARGQWRVHGRPTVGSRAGSGDCALGAGLMTSSFILFFCLLPTSIGG